MAAPSDITLKNLSGSWTLNKKLTGSYEPILALQGIGWVTRKAMTLASVTLNITEYVDEEGVDRIDIDQIVTGGLKGTTERRIVNWESHDHEDHFFGKVKGRSRWMKLSEVSDSFLKNGWLPEMNDVDVLYNIIESYTNGWTAEQVWGFATIDGERRYVRHVLVTKGSARQELVMVYDFLARK